MQNIKLVVVGDGAVGKSCLCIAYTTNSFPAEYVPTVFDNYCANVMIDGKPIQLGLWDTAGQEDYDRLRPLSYPQTDVFLVGFSMVSSSSLKNISTKWVPEIKHHMPHTPFVIVGLKCDLEEKNQMSENNQYQIINREDAIRVGKEVGAKDVVFCSSLTSNGIKNVFDVCVRVALSSANNSGGKKSKGFSFGSLFSSSSSKKKSKYPPRPDPPVMPAPTDHAPWLNIESAHIAQDWKKLVNNKYCHDLRFNFVKFTGAQKRKQQTIGMMGGAYANEQPPLISQSSSIQDKEYVGDGPLYAHQSILGCCWDIFNKLLQYPARNMKRLLINPRSRDYLDTWTIPHINEFTNQGFIKAVIWKENKKNIGGEGQKKGLDFDGEIGEDEELNENLIIFEINDGIIDRQLFLYCLQFVYTGSCAVQLSECTELQNLANRLFIDELASMCSNMNMLANQTEECKVMNESIGTYWIDSCADIYKEILFNQCFKSDLQITTKYIVSKNQMNKSGDELEQKECTNAEQEVKVEEEEKQIPGQQSSLVKAEMMLNDDISQFRAHKIIPFCRCDVLWTYYNNNFGNNNIVDEVDSNVVCIDMNDIQSKVFRLFLEYLYTDHANIMKEDHTVFDLLFFADLMHQPRLVSWCEYRITKIIEKAVEQSVEKANIDCIGLLLMSQKHRASQLEAFLLHFISTNYEPMKKRKEFSLLVGKNLDYMNEHRWPPKWYEDQCLEYEQELKVWKKKYGKKGNRNNASDDCLIM